MCNLTIQNHSHHSEPTPEIAVEALERVFHLRFLKSDQKKKKKSSSYVGALGRAGARLAGLVLTAEARSLLDW